jgi:hypothetical protein
MPGGIVKSYKDRVVDSIPERDRVAARWNKSNWGQGIIVLNAFANYPEVGEGDPTVISPTSQAYYKFTKDGFIKIAEGESLDLPIGQLANELQIGLVEEASETETNTNISTSTTSGARLFLSIAKLWGWWTFIKTTAQTISNTWTFINPVFTGTPTAPTPPQGTNNNQLATTSFVNNASTKRQCYFVFNSDLFTEQALSFRGYINNISFYITNEIQFITFEAKLNTANNWQSFIDGTQLQNWINTNITGNENSGTIYWIKVLAVYKPNAIGQAEARLTFNATA